MMTLNEIVRFSLSRVCTRRAARFSDFLLLVLALLLCQRSMTSWGASPQPVMVEQGPVIGIKYAGVTAFLGLPYAAPPVGHNRWRPPQPAEKWTAVRKADSFGSKCTQAPGQVYGPYSKEYITPGPPSEDCLYVNVWTPTPTAGKTVPVVVWIHGGGFSMGSGSLAIFDGAALASKGIVVVTINYRLGPFGYLAHPELSAEDSHHSSGTYGLLDQIAALKWVRTNIARFGGDPGKVTVAGESAGAISTNALIVSPLAAGLFQRALIMSGSGMGFPAPTLAEAEKRGVKFADSLGARDLASLRSMPADKILSGARWVPTEPPATPQFQFWPVIDGWVLPGDPDSGATRPKSPVPLMTGFNADENFTVAVKTVADFKKYVLGWFGSHADRVLELYPHATNEEAMSSTRVLARDRYMTSMILWIAARTKNSKQPVYPYIYDHPSPSATEPSYGSFHTAGVPYFFGNLDTAIRPFGRSDRQVSDQIQRYLLQFVETGDPNGPDLANWPRARQSSLTAMAFGLKPGLREAVSNQARFDALRESVPDGGVLSLF